MSGYELLSDQGLRLDGRRSGELRRIRCKVGVFGQADGSAYFEQVYKFLDYYHFHTRFQSNNMSGACIIIFLRS